MLIVFLSLFIEVLFLHHEVFKIDKDIEVPFFFGGDGASFLVPGNLVQQLVMVLENVKEQVYKDYFLSLRVGEVQIGKLNESIKSTIKISRIQLTEHVNLPITYGNGLKVGEDYIKSQFSDDNLKPRADMYIDIKGCSCRWLKIKPPLENQKVLCFIATPFNLEHLDVLRSISERLDHTFGKYSERLPITVEGLGRLESINEIHNEYNDFFDNSFLDTISVSLAAISQKMYNASASSSDFMSLLALSSVAMLIDGSYCDIVIGDDAQINKFIDFLNTLEKDSKLTFGYHVTDSAILSCYIAQRNNSFIHLMDANEGGFSKAATMLKIKMKVN